MRDFDKRPKLSDTSALVARGINPVYNRRSTVEGTAEAMRSPNGVALTNRASPDRGTSVSDELNHC